MFYKIQFYSTFKDIYFALMTYSLHMRVRAQLSSVIFTDGLCFDQDVSLECKSYVSLNHLFMTCFSCKTHMDPYTAIIKHTVMSI